MKSDEETLIERGRQLASACTTGRNKIQDYQLGQVMAHLKRHRSVAATLQLVGNLDKSSFASRANHAPHQFRALAQNIRTALMGISDWQKAAAIVGWAKRLLKATEAGH